MDIKWTRACDGYSDCRPPAGPLHLVINTASSSSVERSIFSVGQYIIARRRRCASAPALAFILVRLQSESEAIEKTDELFSRTATTCVQLSALTEYSADAAIYRASSCIRKRKRRKRYKDAFKANLTMLDINPARSTLRV